MKAGALPVSSSPSSKHGYADRHSSSRIRNALFRLLGIACVAVVVVYLARLGTTLTAIRDTVRVQGAELTGMRAHMASAISDGTEDVRSQVTQHRDKLVSLETSWKMMEDETSSRQKQAEEKIANIEKKLAEIWEMKESFNSKMQKIEADTKPLMSEFGKIQDMPAKFDENAKGIHMMRADIDNLRTLVDVIVKGMEDVKKGGSENARRLVEAVERARTVASGQQQGGQQAAEQKPAMSEADEAAQRLAQQVQAVKQGQDGTQEQPQPAPEVTLDPTKSDEEVLGMLDTQDAAGGDAAKRKAQLEVAMKAMEEAKRKAEEAKKQGDGEPGKKDGDLADLLDEEENSGDKA